MNQCKRSRGTSKGKGKMQSCTVKFYCLAKIGTEKPPSTIYEKTYLSNCGLGPGSISFNIDGTNVHQNLTERFPLLEQAGGYELLLFQRGGAEQGFHRIPPPYTPRRIKELAGQAQVYIRPLQKNVDELGEIKQEVSMTVKVRMFAILTLEGSMIPILLGQNQLDLICVFLTRLTIVLKTHENRQCMGIVLHFRPKSILWYFQTRVTTSGNVWVKNKCSNLFCFF